MATVTGGDCHGGVCFAGCGLTGLLSWQGGRGVLLRQAG